MIRGKVYMKSLIFCIVGIWIIIFVLLCPFPPLFGIPGLIWRAIVGTMGCSILILGLYGRRKS
jgi:hypothetical protein